MFNINAEVAAQNESKGNFLKGGEIHKVKLSEVKAETIKTKNGDSDVLRIEVVNEKGAKYVETLFEPSSEDFQRKTSDKGKVQPSNWEQTLNKVMQYISGFRPKLFEDIRNKTVKIEAKNWDDFRKRIIKELKAAVGKTETNFKLVKNKSGYAVTPGWPAALNKEGELFTGNHFIGDDLSFSDFEIEHMKKVAQAAPSSMQSTIGGSEDIDLNSELDDLSDIDLTELDAL